MKKDTACGWCYICKTEKPPEDFYKRTPCKKRPRGLSSSCKPCSVMRLKERRREVKRQCVEYCGGRCMRCGYNKFYGALQFHHRDPTQKDFSLGRRANRAFTDEIKAELDKCDLLCANCHAEVHSELGISNDDP